ncbi:monoacylglycerol lipase ABHD12 isoform X1 [Anoplophora glabripennis]|uniref:monoacylglycerol lipase ABHD12 isoform X1 n=2 Tax=Anoplophora glabripennis TaxID=217634 RepID=UPI000873EB4E|nr:monoacylglycerol lipase ABHD12 isoform X1 [Anoplophora glabripennis]
MPSIRCSRKPSTDSYTSVDSSNSSPKKRPMWQTILIIVGIVIFVLAFLIFLAIWVAVPIAFMQSLSFQKFMIFINIDAPKDPDYNNPQKYGMESVVNFHITTQDLDNTTLVSIGSWMIVHEDEMDTFSSSTQSSDTASEIVTNTKKPVIIYMHGVACNRVKPLATYKVLRKFFLVIAPDHRGYGDSGLDADLSEDGIVSDTVQLYKWVRYKTSNMIYFWGHSLGSALATHAVKILKEQDGIIPTGLVLESPFTTMRDEMINHPLGKIYKWLAYFNQTILDPPERNGMLFLSTTNILYVDCPIMIMHAEDDNVIPYFLGKTLAEIAKSQRDLQTQGNVTYHQFPSVGYQHIGITDDPNVPQYITEFMQECVEADKGRG